MVGRGVVIVNGAEHTKVIGVDIGLLAGAKGTIVSPVGIIFGTSERLMTCWTSRDSSDFESMGLRVANDNGVVMPAKDRGLA